MVKQILNDRQKKTRSELAELNKPIARRKFLRYTAAAGAGLWLSSMAEAGRGETKKSDALHVALIGAGAQGQVLLNACLKIPNIRFQAVCDIWEEYNLKRSYRLLKKYGHELNAYVDYQEMLAREKGLDAVIIASPDFWHARQTVDCLNNGLHVYCEKEMSNTLEGARAMVLAARKTGKLLQIGHQRRSNPRYLHCYEKLIKQAKILGRITTINGQWNRAVQPDVGWPKEFAIPPAVLKKYGFDSMQQYRNWRWYRRLGGGPMVDLGSHQIDIYNWFLDARPKSVLASGGIDYYDPKNHEWYDTVLATFEYQTEYGVVRAFYQTLTTNSNQGYFENFMGDMATLQISESGSRSAIYREPGAPEWDKWVKLQYLKAPEDEPAKPVETGVLDVRETIAPPKYQLPVQMTDPYHQPHLVNFFDAIRGQATLSCPAEVGYETAVTVLKVNDAVKTGQKLHFKPEEFRVA